MAVGRKDFLLEQFKQAHEYHRHYDRMGWIMISLFLPVSLGVFAYAAKYVAETRDDVKWEVLIPLAVVSFFTLFVMRIMYGRMSYYQDWRSRPFIHEIEREFCGYHYYRYYKEPEPTSCEDSNCQLMNWKRGNKYYLSDIYNYYEQTRRKWWWCCLRKRILNIRNSLNILVIIYAASWIALVCVAALRINQD